MNVNSSAIFLLLLDLILAFEGKKLYFYSSPSDYMEQNGGEKKTFEENGNHENHFEYFINNNGTRTVSSMTGSLASNTNTSV